MKSIMRQNSYDQIAQRWHDNPRPQHYVARVLNYVDQVLAGLSPRSKVLDLGCGTGDPIARHSLLRGYRVTAIDQSLEMLRIASQVVPAAQLIHGDMLQVEFGEGFGAAMAWDSAFHIARKHHATLYQKLAKALMVGGKLLLSVGGSDSQDPGVAAAEDEGFTSEMFGQKFYYSAYDPEVARSLLESAGFEIELWEVDDPGSRGHIAVIARRKA
jgi:SAM-dependent methyltransferase